MTFIDQLLQGGKMVMDEAAIERKQSDVKAIIDDAITSLVMQGLTSQGAIALLAFQSIIRIDDTAELRSLLESIESKIAIYDGPDDEDA